MEIHAPEGPVHSFKDFFVHISIVTVGILIALGLEGLREMVHTRHLVREMREDVSSEMKRTLGHVDQECARVNAYNNVLSELVAQLPQLAEQHPEQVRARLNANSNPGFFLSANSFQVALSTGVLAHMSTAEVSAYAYAAEGTKTYSALQSAAMTAENRAKAYVDSHPHLSADQLAQETQELIMFADAEHELAFVCPQVRSDVDDALRASEAH